jgi:osmotically-inducible protein OsmY
MPQSDMSGSGVQSKIQSALQANPNLSGVSVSADDKGRIELTGTANSAQDRKEALRIAKENANGAKVKDHIKVGNSATSSTGSSNPK